MTMWLLPQVALADGPITPSATDYLAHVTHTPAGFEAEIVDGYLSIWGRAAPESTVIIEDYRGAPFIWFARSGVYVNHNSEEYYLNQVPVPAVPPKGLTARTKPNWVKVSSGRTYTWREGRLHALATIQLQPGQSYVGRWSIPMTVNGSKTTLSGTIYHHPPPSLVWFWPVLVMLLCALAAWRIRSAALDRKLARVLTLTLMGLFAIATASRELHGRPDISAWQVAGLLAILAVVAAGAWRVISRDGPGIAMLLTTAVVAMWGGVTLIPVLTHGYVLIAFGPFIDRCVAAALLGGSLSLLLIGVRLLGGIPQDSGDDGDPTLDQALA